MHSSKDVNAINESGDFAKLCNYQTYIKSFDECKQDTIWKSSVQTFEYNCVIECFKLAKEVKARIYKPDKYREFDICERGKKRHIKAPLVRDRVFSHALCTQVLNPILRKHLIYDNSAALKRRGITFARKRILTHLHRYYTEHKTNRGYILQTDFKKFFDSIDHTILYQQFCKYIKDTEVQRLIKIIIDSFGGNKGLGIGSELSQTAGVFFPSPIDQYCKTVRACKYYARHMDDIYIIHHDKDFLNSVYAGMQKIASELKLEFNPNKCHINRLDKQFTYLKSTYTLTSTGAVFWKPCKESLRRERNKLKRLKNKLNQGRLQLLDIQTAYKSWRGNIIKQFPKISRSITCKFDALYKELYGDF